MQCTCGIQCITYATANRHIAYIYCGKYISQIFELATVSFYLCSKAQPTKKFVANILVNMCLLELANENQGIRARY
jgi:hypothetical protein